MRPEQVIRKVETDEDENHALSLVEEEGLLWHTELGPEVSRGSMCVVVTKLPSGALEMAR